MATPTVSLSVAQSLSRLPAPTSDELILALSHIVTRGEYRPPSPLGGYDDFRNKHLKRLDLLSLLLVTRASGDVAAVMFRVLARDGLELHYAKSRSCTIDETTYVENLFAIVREMSTDTDANGDITRWDLLKLVIPKCKHKIMSRLEKIRRRLLEISTAASSVGVFSSPLTPYFAITASACSAASEKALRDAIGLSVFPAPATLQRFLQGWFTSIYNRPGPIFKDWHVASVHHTLRIAYYIGQIPDIANILDSTLLNRVRKLGDFYAAAITLISNAAQLPHDQLRNLRIIEVFGATPRTLHLSDDFVGTVNTWARHTGEPEVSANDLRMAFPEMDKVKTGPAGTQAVTVTVHCECTLLLSMLGGSSTPPSVAPALLEIGVSKSSCFMCREFVMTVQEQYRHLTVLISSCHGKHVAGWSLPDSAPHPLKEAMRKRVCDEMEEVLQRSARKRKSDSIPRAVVSDHGAAAAHSAENDVEIVREQGGWVFSLEEDGGVGV